MDKAMDKAAEGGAAPAAAGPSAKEPGVENLRTGSVWATVPKSEAETVKTIQSGIVSEFPLAVQQQLIRTVIGHVLQGPATAHLKTRGHVRWVMEVVGQAFALPLDDIDMIKSALGLYRSWFLTNVPAAIAGEIDRFICDMMRNLGAVLADRDASGAMLDQHIDLAVRAIELMTEATRHHALTSQATWVTLIHILLARGVQAVAMDMDDHEAALEKEKCFAGSIAPDLISLLLELLLRSRTRDAPTWQTFRSLFQKWRHRPHVVLCGCQLTEAITAAVLRAQYNVVADKAKSQRVVRSQRSIVLDDILAVGGDDDVQPPSPNQPGGNGGGRDKARARIRIGDKRSACLELEADELGFVWKMLLSLPGDILEVQTAQSFVFLATSAANITSMLLRARNGVKGAAGLELQLPDALTAFSITGPFLFRCVRADEKRLDIADGRASALGALCHVMCYQRAPARALPQNLQLAFIRAVHTTLTQTAKPNLPAIVTCLTSTLALQSQNFKGTLALVPVMVAQVRALLGRNECPHELPEKASWTTVRRHAATLLRSFLGIGSAYPSLALLFSDIPSDLQPPLTAGPVTEFEGMLSTNHAKFLTPMLANTLIAAFEKETDLVNQRELIWKLMAVAFEDTTRPATVRAVLTTLRQRILDPQASIGVPLALAGMQAILHLLPHPLSNGDAAFSHALFQCVSTSVAAWMASGEGGGGGQLGDLMAAGFACLADLVVLHDVPVTNNAGVVGVVMNGMASFAPSHSPDPAALPAATCLLRWLNTLPPCHPPLRERELGNELPTIHACCPVTNAIISLTDSGNSEEGVRVVVRDMIGEFVFHASPVWENDQQRAEREEGEKLQLQHNEAGWKEPPVDDAVDSALAAVHANANAAFTSRVAHCDPQPTPQATNLKGTSPSDAFPPPCLPMPPPDAYHPELGGPRTHLARLLLSSVGGMCPVINADDVCLLSHGAEVEQAIQELDSHHPYQAVFHVGVMSDVSEEDDKEFKAFFTGLGVGTGRLRVWEDRRVRVHFHNRHAAPAAVDEVKVKWCSVLPNEDALAVDPSHIFVYPLKPNLYHIRVSRDVQVDMVGPLLDHMIVSHETVGRLLTITACNFAGGRSFRKGPDYAQKERADCISGIIEHFRCENTVLSTLKRS